MTDSLKDALNRANPNSFPDGLRQLGLGDMLRTMPTYLRRKASAASSSQLATLQALGLGAVGGASVGQNGFDHMAASILRLTVRAGSVTGEYTPVAYGVTPTTGQCAVAPNGDIVVLATDAPTDLDCVYMPEKGDVVVLAELPVATNVLTIPASFAAAVPGKGVILLLSALVTAGGSVGQKIILVPGAGAPAAGQARLNVAKSTVTFAGADAVTKAICTLLCTSSIDVDALLSGAAAII